MGANSKGAGEEGIGAAMLSGETGDWFDESSDVVSQQHLKSIASDD